MKTLERLDHWIARAEKYIIVVLLSAMILVGFLQILLRNLFDTGMPWGDSLVRYLVLWVGFIGAALAVKENKHIRIDVFSRWLPVKGQALNRTVIALFSCLLCILLTYSACKFIRIEILMGERTFGRLPVWLLALVLPATFAIMALRYALRALRQLRWNPSDTDKPEPDEDL
jgi:TRAP-type C4-dicarboxylate transport system permease small subunit